MVLDSTMKWWKDIETFFNTKVPQQFGSATSDVCNVLKKVLHKLEDLSRKFQKNQKENQESTERGSSKIIQYASDGGVFAAFMNHVHFLVKIGGRSSNIVTVFDKTSISSLGNPRWFARVDMPHTNVPFHHINVNKAITGVPDPHFRISAASAQIAGKVGELMYYVNKATPYLMIATIAYEAYQIKKSIDMDIRNGSCRNTIEEVSVFLIVTAGGIAGAVTGASIGTAVFPGVGTLVGGIVGGLIGGVAAGFVGEKVADTVLDLLGCDIDKVACEKCEEKFNRRTYQEGKAQKRCENCREEPSNEEKKKKKKKTFGEYVEEAIIIAGTVVGAASGFLAGAAVGTLVCPVIGTLVGGVVCGLLGGVAGGYAGECVFNFFDNLFGKKNK